MSKKRIKLADIESLVDCINDNEDVSAWNSQKGFYSLDSAYGGIRLVKNCTKKGGIRVISHDGFGTKRELHSFLNKAINNSDILG